MKGYFVPLDKINELQAASIERSIQRCKHAHHTDLQIRINGAYEYAEADWIKHMLVLPEIDDLAAARMEIGELRNKVADQKRVIDHYTAEQSAKYSAGYGSLQRPERSPS